MRGSQATREADAVLLTRAGTEVGVAATKTFVSQVTALFLLALSLADVRRALPVARLTGLAEELVALPGAIETVLARTGEQVAALAERWHREGFFLFLGRDRQEETILTLVEELKQVKAERNEADGPRRAVAIP